jgi:acylphosphatase
MDRAESAGREPASADVLILGRVQGVGFRAYAHASACRLGLAGFVMNLRAGGVRAYAEGPQHALDLFVRLLERGPTGSLVQRVHAVWGRPSGRYARFEIDATR